MNQSETTATAELSTYINDEFEKALPTLLQFLEIPS
jgi:hypothetical protein